MHSHCTAPAQRQRGRRTPLDRPGIPAVDAVEGAAAGRAQVVHQRRGAAQGAGHRRDQRRVGDDHDARATSPRRWRAPSPRSPASRSSHDLIQEGDVVEKLQTSMQSGKSIYDGWITDSDLIGTHYRYGAVLPLSDFMAGAGKAYTNPGPGPEGLHRREVRHRAGRQAVPAARPAVREPLLVPRRLVRAQGPAGRKFKKPSTATSSACR